MYAEASLKLTVIRQESLVALLILLAGGTYAQSVCGDFYNIDVDTVGRIYSPNYPGDYPVNSFCIWLIMVPEQHQVYLLLNFSGESYKNVCSDYIEIRDGNSGETLLGLFCQDHVNEMVNSSRNMMWIKFKSDRINETGKTMQAEFGVKDNNSNSAIGKIALKECRSYEFVCRNKECVSMSYRCDGHNDCGCIKDCDEAMCDGLQMDKKLQVAISLISGFFVFTILCLITYCIEGKNHWIASQAEALREKEILAEKQRQRASRAFTKFIGGEKELLTHNKSKINMPRFASSQSIH